MLEVSHLRKTFDRVVAVDDFSLQVHRGELYGLLGPNGAGKTTTIRTVLDIIKPDSGEISFDGKPFTHELWNRIGYLPEERGLYRKSKILNTILYFAALKGVGEKEARHHAHAWLERFDLTTGAHGKVEELSKGNQQKVQIICALIHSPDLVILDEPFSGLDPVNQILLKDILLELRASNVAIIFSTHQMEQVERLCDNMSLINRGKAVLQGSIRDIKASHGTNSVHIEYEGDGTFLKTLKGVKRADVYQNAAELELEDLAVAGSMLAGIARKLNVTKYEMREPSLQSIFVSVVGGEEKIQKAAAKTIEGLRKPSGMSSSPAVSRKDLLRVALSVVIAIVLGVREFLSEQPQPLMMVVVAGIFAVAAYQYLRARRGVPQGPSEGDAS